jgi:hypothetical protein
MPSFQPRLALAALLTLATCSAANAHCEIGDRTFASTITFDDPCVTDELSLPTIQSFKNGDQPAAQELDVSGEYTKTITRNFGISIEEEWVHLDIPGEGDRSGFDNLGTSFKYQFIRDAYRELAMSVSLDVDWGGTGAKAIDAEPFTTLTPTWFAGKGFGSASSGFLRPLAVTTELGYAFPTQSSTIEIEDGFAVKAHNPQVLVWGGSVQYSMPYLKEKVADLGLPGFVNHLILITEFNFQTATSNFDEGERTTGTINPGVIYMADKFQLGIEAIIPVNRASGNDVGVIGNATFFLEDILPRSLGRPLFASASGDH